MCSIKRCIVFAIAFVFLAGCATQKLQVNSSPDGADVHLKRRGVTEMGGSFKGVSGQAEGDGFEEDDFYFLGKTPLTYEFDLEETQSSVGVPGVANVSVERRFTEGVLRIELEGHSPIEKTVRFTGDDIAFDFELLGVDKDVGEPLPDKLDPAPDTNTDETRPTEEPSVEPETSPEASGAEKEEPSVEPKTTPKASDAENGPQ